jgi:hypothetical protein
MDLDRLKTQTAALVTVAEKIAAPVRMAFVTDGAPSICLDLADFRRVFAGQDVDLKTDGNTDVYTATVDGVTVRADDYTPRRSAASTTKVTLPPIEPPPIEAPAAAPVA